MALRVMVVGGYGNFGSIVCRHLVVTPGVDLVISGRDPHKFVHLQDGFGTREPFVLLKLGYEDG